MVGQEGGSEQQQACFPFPFLPIQATSLWICATTPTAGCLPTPTAEPEDFSWPHFSKATSPSGTTLRTSLHHMGFQGTLSSHHSIAGHLYVPFCGRPKYHPLCSCRCGRGPLLLQCLARLLDSRVVILVVARWELLPIYVEQEFQRIVRVQTSTRTPEVAVECGVSV